MQTDNDIIISFYKDPKTGLSINNTFRNLLKAGHKFTLRQVQVISRHLTHHSTQASYLQILDQNLTQKISTHGWNRRR